MILRFQSSEKPLIVELEKPKNQFDLSDEAVVKFWRDGYKRFLTEYHLEDGTITYEQEAVKKAGQNGHPGISEKKHVAMIPLRHLVKFVKEFKDRIIIDEDNAERMKSFLARRDRAIKIKEIIPDDYDKLNDPVKDVDIFNGTIYPHQRSGVHFGLTQKTFLLADEMGTGKTVIGCALLAYLWKKEGIMKHLIICPSQAKEVWREHIEKFLPSIYPLCCVVTPTNRNYQYPITIVNYELIAADYINLIMHRMVNWQCIMADEVHKIKNRDTKKAQCLHTISNPDINKEIQYKFGISGTPIHNSLEDLWSVFKFVNPEVLGENFFEFQREHVVQFGHKKIFANPQGCREKIYTFFLRRLKEDVLKHLPEKMYSNHILELQLEEYEMYLRFEEELLIETENESIQVSEVSVLAKLTRLFQISSGRFLPENFDFWDSTKFMELKEVLDEVVYPEGGIEVQDKYEEEIKQPIRKVVVFSRFEEIVHAIYDALKEKCPEYPAILFTGKSHEKYRVTSEDKALGLDQKQAYRRWAVKQFQENEKNPIVMLATVQAGGESITLTRASYCIHYDKWWNPQVAIQAEDRLHRDGQKVTVNVLSFIAKDTIEEELEIQLKQKTKLAGIITGDKIDRFAIKNLIQDSRKRRSRTYDLEMIQKEIKKRLAKVKKNKK